jgi:hypothetical protein
MSATAKIARLRRTTGFANETQRQAVEAARHVEPADGGTVS